MADGPILHGDSVGRPNLVALPGGGFLMLKAEDMPKGGVLLRSDDGRTWNKVDASGSGLDVGHLEYMAANETTAVILGTLEPLTGTGDESLELFEWTSPDGVTWTRAPEDTVWRDFGGGSITGSPRGFVSRADARWTILMSGPDGWPWQRTDVPVPPGATGSLTGVGPVGDGYRAVGDVDGRFAMWRWDGGGWFRQPLDDLDGMMSVTESGERMIGSGDVETPDPRHPGQTRLTGVAWESTDGGTTWGDTGLPLDGTNDVGVIPMDGGFLALVYPGDPDEPFSALRSIRSGVWEPVTLDAGARGSERPLVGVMAVSGTRVVLAGSTVGTGGGGDRVVIWTGDTTP